MLFVSTSSSTELGSTFGMGIEYGGQSIGSYEFSDGTTKDIKSNEGTIIYGGISYSFNNKYYIKTVGGTKFKSIIQKNEYILFKRYLLELNLQRKIGKHYLGIGPIAHILPKFNCDMAAPCSSNSYEHAFGLAVQYEYKLPTEITDKNYLTMALRYTYIDYKLDIYKGNPSSLSANGIGLIVNMYYY